MTRTDIAVHSYASYVSEDAENASKATPKVYNRVNSYGEVVVQIPGVIARAEKEVCRTDRAIVVFKGGEVSPIS